MYNFIYSSSNEYAPYCLTSIYSLLKHNKGLENIVFYILSNGIKEGTKARISGLCREYYADVVFIECDRAIRQIVEKGGKLNFNPSSFLRIFIPKLLPEDVEKALFIDSDTYINAGIAELYHTDISEHYCAMSYNQPIYDEMLQEAALSVEEGYFNAGVILMNLKLWREEDISGKILDYYYANGGCFLTDDQSVINAIVARKTVVLHYQYNAMIGNFYWSYRKFCSINTQIGCKTQEEYLQARKNPVIVHFNGPGIRPWEKWCAHPYTKKYREDLKLLVPAFKLKQARRKKDYLWGQYFKHIVADRIERAVNDGLFRKCR